MAVPGLLVLSACTSAPEVACPAIGWPAALAVRLAPTWPSGTAETVQLSCSGTEACGIEVPALDDEPTAPAPQELLAGVAGFDLLTAAPDTVVVTVLDPDGEALATHEARLDWVRVGGTEECGGPSEAEVVVPAP